MMGMSTPTYRSLASFQQHGSNTNAELENLSSNYSSLWLEGSLNRDDMISVNHSIPPLNLGMDHTLHPGQQSIVSSNPPSHPTLGQFAHQYSCNFATENMVDERANTGLLNQQATNATIVSQPPREVSEQQSRTMGRLSAASIAMLSNPPNHPLLQQFAEQYLPYFSSSDSSDRWQTQMDRLQTDLMCNKLISQWHVSTLDNKNISVDSFYDMVDGGWSSMYGWWWRQTYPTRSILI